MVDALAAVNFTNPLVQAVIIGWILTVVLHEFAHGIVAHWGGDYTVRERGGLTLNPIQYIHPVYSILMPALFLLIGGVPLPGAATYVRIDLLRNRAWQSAVSLAGPAINLLLFLVGAAALHPKVGWIETDVRVEDWTGGQRVVATLTFLQLYAVILNLVPVPPLDGFGAISPFLKEETRRRLTTPPTSIVLLLLLFVLVMSEGVQRQFYALVKGAYRLLGYSDGMANDMLRAFYRTLFG